MTWFKIQKGEETQIVDDPSAYGGDWKVIETLQDIPEQDVVAQLSDEHVRQMHAIKVMEATLILAGNSIPNGLLAAEAEALGQDVFGLAKQVREKVADQHKLEVQRRLRKKGFKSDKF